MQDGIGKGEEKGRDTSKGTAIAGVRVGVEVLLDSLPGAGERGRCWLGGPGRSGS